MQKIIRGEEWRALDAAAPVWERDDDVLRHARENIEKERKRAVTLRLVDRRGRPLAGSPVEVELLQHAFPFGEQVWPLDAAYRNGQGDSEFARAWKGRFTEVFNAATNLCYWTERPENDASKTEDRQGQPRVGNFSDTVDWTRAAGLQAKGHPLFWSIPKCTPEWVKRYDQATFWKFAEVRVRNLVASMRGRVTIWDAVNEALWEAAPQNLSQRVWPHIETVPVMADYIQKVLTWCREEDPDALYLINDYGLVAEENPRAGSDGSVVTASTQRKRYLALTRELAERGCAPNAIGLQAHTGWVSYRLLWEVLTEMSAAGVPLHITEFWANPDALRAAGLPEDEIDARVAQYVGDFLTIAFGHPAVDAFFFWGFMDAAIRWKPSGGHSTRPVYERVRRLIRSEWHIREQAKTCGQGTVTLPLFDGRYAVRVPTGNGGQTGRTVEIRTPPGGGGVITLVAGT